MYVWREKESQGLDYEKEIKKMAGMCDCANV